MRVLLGHSSGSGHHKAAASNQWRFDVQRKVLIPTAFMLPAPCPVHSHPAAIPLPSLSFRTIPAAMLPSAITAQSPTALPGMQPHSPHPCHILARTWPAPAAPHAASVPPCPYTYLHGHGQGLLQQRVLIKLHV